MFYIESKACCVNRYTSIGGLCSVDSSGNPYGSLVVYSSVRSRTAVR